MTKTLLLALTLLCCSAWTVAQTSPDQSGGSAGSKAGTSERQTTIQGCLMSSGGNYMVTDSSGMQYQLTGNTESLSSHVNHQVKVKGMVSGSESGASATGTQGTGTATTAEAGSSQMFHVSKVTKISDSCSTSK